MVADDNGVLFSIISNALSDFSIAGKTGANDNPAAVVEWWTPTIEVGLSEEAGGVSEE